MKRVIYSLLLLLQPLVASGQWTKAASALVGSLFQNDGAMTYCAGTVWVGTDALWSSTDKGLTWTNNGLIPAGIIAHIFFLNQNDGLVTTHTGNIYRTSDGGLTWTNILSIGSATSACFLDNANNILVSEFQAGAVHYSRDGGMTWNTVQNNNWIREIIPESKGVAYLLSGDWGPQEHVWKTTDYGASWTEQSGQVDADSYSFDVNACDNNRMIVVNEEYSITADYDGTSELFVSSDEGMTWTVTSNHPSKYFAGSVTLGPHTVFCQTVSEANAGLVRSTDNGQTWVNIGGPSSTGDTRLIAAIDDNHLVACGKDGSIWVTSNSGGDSIQLQQLTSSSSMLLLSSSEARFVRNSCNIIDTSLPLLIVSCAPVSAHLDSLWLTGSLAFMLSDTRSAPRALEPIDSIRISYASAGGTDTAELHIRYDLGSGVRDTTILLTGMTASPLLAQAQRLHREAASAYFGQVDSLPLGVDISSAVNLDSLWPYLHDIQATFAFDSSIVSFASYTPPAGWTIASLANHGNSVDFGIHKISGTAVNPLDLGTALFLPNTTELATSWVTLPRFVIDEGGQSLSLCVTDNEDSHWAVKTLGAESDVAEVPAKPEGIWIYPNPAKNEVFVQNQYVHSASLSIYDAVGRVVETANVAAGTTQTLTIEPLIPGTYFIVCHIGNEVITRHLIKTE